MCGKRAAVAPGITIGDDNMSQLVAHRLNNGTAGIALMIGKTGHFIFS
jgi:hypothetical protein